MYFKEKLVCLRDIDFHWPISGFPMTHLFKLANQLRQNEGVSTGLFNIFQFVRVCIHALLSRPHNRVALLVKKWPSKLKLLSALIPNDLDENFKSLLFLTISRFSFLNASGP